MNESEIRDELVGMVEELFPFALGNTPFPMRDGQAMAIQARLAQIKAMPKPGLVPAQMSARETMAMHLCGAYILAGFGTLAHEHAVEKADELLESLGTSKSKDPYEQIVDELVERRS